jgi:S1-C subfamily serine protease
MPIELRILSGARAGQTKTFEKSQIAIGRHPANDFAFDVANDLDVSSKHGEIRRTGDSYVINDLNSTNGTYVNGERVAAGSPRTLKNGDTVSFGAHGPKMSVQLAAQPLPKTNVESARPTPPAPAMTDPIAATLMGGGRDAKYDPSYRPPAAAAPAPTSAAPKMPPKKDRGTGERIAIAVKQQTRVLRYGIIGAVVILGGIAGGAVVIERRDAAKRSQEITDLLATNEQMSKKFQAQLQGMNDTSLTNSWKRRADSLSNNARDAHNDSERAAALDALRREGERQKQMTASDWPTIRAKVDPAVVLINSEMGNTAQEATGFAITAGGLIVTNQHVVEDSASGTRATRIHVKYANSKSWRGAHIVKIAPKGVDVALIQLDQPLVLGFATLASKVDAPVADQIMTIGFPDGTSLPMGEDQMAKTTTAFGNISKSIADLIQVDAYATHGSSGSPVVDAHGHVIGVIYGGMHDSNGRIAYAVPAEKISELVKSVK